jgi:maltose O-acetyltransferase
MTERDAMLAGERYFSADPELQSLRLRARKLTKLFNDSDPADTDARTSLLRELLASMGRDCTIEPPFYCDYGRFISLGDSVFINFGCVILDCARVSIGNNCMFGPNVQLLCAYHPLDPTERNSGYEYASSITIGDNVWLGGGVIINPGVTIGSNTVIGSGSVVTKDVPPNVVAFGNPCRVVKQL